MVRAPASPPDRDPSQPPAFPLVGPSDPTAGDLSSALHRFEPAEPAESAPSDASSAAADPGESGAPARSAASAAPQQARPAAAPTADDVAGELRHTLLVERERFGVLADLW